MTEEQYQELLKRNTDLNVIDGGDGIAPKSEPIPQPKRHKYGAQKTEVDGITFDSKKEAKRYVILEHMVRVGDISGLELQPTFTLQEAYSTRDGKKVRPIKYVGDFQYWRDGRCIVEDVKGMQTPVFKLKAKMFRFKYPEIELAIV